MKFEVIQNSQKKEIFAFPNSQTVIVGRRLDADIRLVSNDISRDHLHIKFKGGKVFALDNGSTCGVFMNNEQIPAFKDIEFTKLMPLQLGDDYLISLISIDDVEVKSSSLKLELDFKEHTKTYNVYRAKPVRRKRIKEEEEPKSGSLTKLMVVLIIIVLISIFLKSR